MLNVMFSSLRKRQENLRNKKGGFTLIELIVVIAILAILMAILVPSISGMIGNARHTSAVADARSIYVAAQSVATQRQAAGGSLKVASDASGKEVWSDTSGDDVIVMDDLKNTLGKDFTDKITSYADSSTATSSTTSSVASTDYTGSTTIIIKSILTDTSGNIKSVTIFEKGVKGDNGNANAPITYPQSKTSTTSSSSTPS